MLVKYDYLHKPHVKGFIDYLSKIIDGKIPIDFLISFGSRSPVYSGFYEKIEGLSGINIENRDTRTVRAETLEAMFRLYWWQRRDFPQNEVILHAIQTEIRNQQGAHFDTERALKTCDAIMSWGFGKGKKAYTNNMKWAIGLGDRLPSTLRAGLDAVSSEHFNPAVFDFSKSPQNPRMNAGWTKYYALASDNYVIYDGRVGAALGFFVRRHLESIPPHFRPTKTPPELDFGWAAGEGSKNLRNPSSSDFIFSQLRHTGRGSAIWAMANVKANWILLEEAKLARGHWCEFGQGLRRLEAALFMIGYDLTLAVQ